jgi:hypothetical protein
MEATSYWELACSRKCVYLAVKRICNTWPVQRIYGDGTTLTLQRENLSRFLETASLNSSVSVEAQNYCSSTVGRPGVKWNSKSVSE